MIDLPFISKGKVRDIYDAGDGRLLMVTSNRISAFDVVLDEPIKDKGKVLTAMTVKWLELLKSIASNHMISHNMSEIENVLDGISLRSYKGQVMLVKKAEMLPIECIVRGYVSGSAWKEYQKEGTIHAQKVRSNMLESEKLDEPIFTPSTKADNGHDENISVNEARNLVGNEILDKAIKICLDSYTLAEELARSRGIIVADTKFELGIVNGELIICDEVLTPDSSRFWDLALYKVGTTPPSFDKQPVRDYLESIDWNKMPPPPKLPQEVVEATSQRYVEAFERIFQQSLEEWEC